MDVYRAGRVPVDDGPKVADQTRVVQAVRFGGGALELVEAASEDTEAAAGIAVLQVMEAHGHLDQALGELPGWAGRCPPPVFPYLMSFEIAPSVERAEPVFDPIGHFRPKALKWGGFGRTGPS